MKIEETDYLCLVFDLLLVSQYEGRPLRNDTLVDLVRKMWFEKGKWNGGDRRGKGERKGRKI